MISEPFVYLKECIAQFTTTGSLVPSSSWAAKALTHPLRQTTRAQKILEVGPGTGAITNKILKDMVDGDHLTLCEINSNFMRALKTKLKKNKDFLRHEKNISFFEGPVQAMPSDYYDVIICAIPFNNLPIAVVEEIFLKLEHLSAEHTRLTFFEYIGIRELGKVVSLKERRAHYDQIERFFKHLRLERNMQCEIVWLNFTPINIYTIQLKRAA